jgi:plasmid stabilization system protein ParE
VAAAAAGADNLVLHLPLELVARVERVLDALASAHPLLRKHRGAGKDRERSMLNHRSIQGGNRPSG